jgi:hypothetical protein
MKPQDRARDIIRKNKCPALQIDLNNGPTGILALIPNGKGSLDPRFCGLVLIGRGHERSHPAADAVMRNRASPPVMAVRDAEPAKNVIPAGPPIITCE